MWIEDDAPREDARRVALLQTYDEIVVGYSETRFLGDPRAVEARRGWKDPAVPNGTLLVDGCVAGHWRRSQTTRGIKAEIRTYAPLRKPDRAALDEEVQALERFVGRPVEAELSAL